MHELIVNGKNILPYSNNISWNSDKDTLGTQITFDSIIDFDEGTIISRYNNSKEYFRGIIIKKTDNKFKYSYTALDYSFYLKNEVIKQFNDVSASTAISSLLGEYGIKSNVVSIPTKINKIYKDQSINAIIDDILEQSQSETGLDYIKEMSIDTLVIKKLIDMKISPKVLIGKDIAINSSIENMKNKIIVMSNNEDNAAIYSTAQDGSNISKYGLLQDIETVEDKDVAKAKNIAANKLKELNKISKDTAIQLQIISGGEDIKANRLIQIKVGKLNDWYRIKSASHNLNNGKYNVSIELEW